jgi:transposase
MAGRPPIELTAELQDLIVGALKAGNYIETAAALAGIHHDTIREWVKKGRRGDPRYEAFADAITQAIASAEARDLAVIGKAAGEYWQAAAWRLERRFNDRWGRKNDVSLSGKNGAPPVKMELVIDLDGTSVEEEASKEEEDDDPIR